MPCSYLLLCALVISGNSVLGQEDARDILFKEGLVKLSDIQVTGTKHVHLAMIIANVKKNDSSQLSSKISRNLSKMLSSILKFSTGTPLHFIVITDEESVELIKVVVKSTVGRYITESVLRNQHILQNIHTPRIVIEFVSLSSITEKYRGDIDFMKKHYGHHHPEGTFYFKEKDNQTVVHIPNNKYTHDLFFIAPFYHREIPKQIIKLIVIDIDLEFRTDMIDLYKQFSKFSPSELIGIGNDLSPHYYGMTQQFRDKNPETKIGTPGRYQGFNSGVTLYHLGKMRNSQEFSLELEPSRMKEIAQQFMFAGSVGDQDWLTVLGWVRPHLFYLLPCHYNVQVHEGLKMPEHVGHWELYRNCSPPEHPDTRVIHYNGSW